MSNDKHAYGWSGHILVSDADHDKEADQHQHNVVVIPDMAFRSIIKSMENCRLPDCIRAERLGVEEGEHYFLAVGHPATFSCGYTFYGTVFENADDRAEGGNAVSPKEHDAEYMAAMFGIYGLTLPPCHLMIGCSVEHE